MLKGCRVVLGGCSQEEPLTQVLLDEAQLVVRMEQDVAGFGKLRVAGGMRSTNVLWKTVNNKIEFSQQIAI